MAAWRSAALSVLALALAVPATGQESLPGGIGTGIVPLAGESATSGQEESASPPQSAPGDRESVTPTPPPSGQESAGAGDGPSLEGDSGTGAPPPPDPDPDPDPRPAVPLTPLAALKRLWLQAVADGRTDAGLEAWIAAELGMDGRPGADAAPADQTGRTRTVSAEWSARAGPVTLGTAGRVVIPFGEAIPRAICSPLTVCYIELEPGEVLTDTPSWGDTARWQVVAKVQGRDPETVVLEIKPAEDAGHTNLVIPTDRRLYTIFLVNDPDVHTPILSFIYPDSAARAAAAAIRERRAKEERDAAAERAAAEAAASVRRARLEREGVKTGSGARLAEDLDFGFRITGKAPFMPVRVFADGQRTYIDLHPRYRGPLPAIVPGSGEENRALNTRVAEGGRRIVADRVIADVWLQAGRQRVRILRAAP